MSQPLLSILIPTTPDRAEMTKALVDELDRQIVDNDGEGAIETLEYQDNYEQTIGEKRNWLLNTAEGKYVAFFDSDDKPSKNYINLLVHGILKDVDCCSLKGIIYEKN